jgi:pimeloyl-ACP methyl ester carboxylesterase
MSRHSTDPATTDPQQIACNSGNAAARDPAAISLLQRRDGPNLAYQRVEPMGFGRQLPGVLFLGGFNSDMTGTKAMALESFCRDRGQGFLRFDYSGHGRSAGDFREGSIGRWKDDALAVFDSLTSGDQILVGSSMGGWIMLLLARARPDRVKAMIGIAAAPDFTENLVWATLSEDDRVRLMHDGHLAQPSEYSATPYVITRKLIEEARDHLLLGSSIAVDVPVRLLHGMADRDVPFQTSLTLAHRLTSTDVEICLVKEGDHRLSRPSDLSKLLHILQLFS